MQFEKKECENTIQVLKETIQALENKDAIKLKELSNRTIHSSCSYQDAGSIATAVLIYALSKLIERQDYKKIKNWEEISKKLISFLDLTIQTLEKNNQEAYSKYMQQARKVLESIIKLKPYISEVLKKAAINKAGKIYEHGLSLEQTSKLLGITQWELAEYIGQKLPDIEQTQTIPVKQRAQMALEFLS